VCGGKIFEVLTAEMVASLVESEGGAVEEPGYDGRKLLWTQEARSALRSIGDHYLRRRTKARIEKSVRLRKLKTVTLEFAEQLIEEETGVPFAPARERPAKGAESEPGASTECQAEATPNGMRLIARDVKKIPLFSAFIWSEEATERILRVPAGFMRERTQARIEELALRQGSEQIDLTCVEAGIELGLQTMTEMIAAEADDSEDREPSEQVVAAGKCPAVARTTSATPPPLNEVGPLTELAALRLLLARQSKSQEN
jgi:hypothetical protein